MYRPLIGRLTRYPIPELRLPVGEGKRFLDVGCNWGRWCVAAARKGYRPVGVDYNLEAVLAARRVARRLGAAATFLVADARHLPFADASFDVAFSYSVLQHLSREDARRSVADIGRTLKPGGTAFVQLASAFGARSLYHLLRRRFREPAGMDVRYWTPGEMRRVFEERVGPATLTVDGFFGLGIQPADLDLLLPRHRLAVRASEALRAASERVGALRWAADSLYVRATRSVA
jgi:SAM-dependent methyltransferase